MEENNRLIKLAQNENIIVEGIPENREIVVIRDDTVTFFSVDLPGDLIALREYVSYHGMSPYNVEPWVAATVIEKHNIDSERVYSNILTAPHENHGKVTGIINVNKCKQFKKN